MSKEKRYIRGNYDVCLPAHLNFGKYMLDRIRRMGNEVAIVNSETGEQITFKEIEEYAVKLAVALSEMGVKKGDIVALGSEKRLIFIPTLIGIALTGAAYTAFDTISGRAHLFHKMTVTQPRFLITSQLFWENNQATLKQFDCVKEFMTLDEPTGFLKSVQSMISSCQDVDVASFEPLDVKGQVDTALVLYSSGTTGMPKGVQISHMNILLDIMPYGFDDKSIEVAFIQGYWHHNYDSYMTYKMFACGAKVVYTTSLTDDVLLNAFEKEQVNIMFLEPSILNRLSKTARRPNEDLNCLKYVYVAAAPIHAKLLKKFKERFPSMILILQSYGMTEAGAITCENWSSNGPKLGSVGSAFPCITIKVEDPDTRKLLGPNEPGEICFKGPKLMNGYVGIDRAKYLDKDGFFRSGDLGYYDEDGYFFIVDRLKEIIGFDGYTVAPLEIETILLLHPGVKEAGVVGKKDPMYGEEPTAFVVRQPGSTVTEQELMDFLSPETCPRWTDDLVKVAVNLAVQEQSQWGSLVDYIEHIPKRAVMSAHPTAQLYRVPPYMHLKGGIKFIKELPKNPRGKTLRRRLREILNGA